MALKRVFERREMKYLLSMADYLALRRLMGSYMQEDEYGRTAIMSLYFDTSDYQMIQSSMAGGDYKEKFRLRSYGTPDPEQPIFLELKKKIERVVYKRRISIPYRTIHQVISPGQIRVIDRPLTANEAQIQREIQWVFDRYRLEPKVLVIYDRIAMFKANDAEFRVTFDFDVRYRTDDVTMADGSFGQPITADFDVIMEVKAMGAYPIWFSDIVNKLRLVRGRFSKYGYIYEHYISQGETNNVTEPV